MPFAMPSSVERSASVPLPTAPVRSSGPRISKSAWPFRPWGARAGDRPEPSRVSASQRMRIVSEATIYTSRTSAVSGLKSPARCKRFDGGRPWNDPPIGAWSGDPRGRESQSCSSRSHSGSDRTRAEETREHLSHRTCHSPPPCLIDNLSAIERVLDAQSNRVPITWRT